MNERVDTAEVQSLTEGDAQLLDVLPASQYEAEHLPGAINIPLPDLTAEAIIRSGLDPARPTVVYCYDHECDLSARGSALLGTFGFTEVYDYVDSRTAWMGEGLPVEGSVPASSRAGAVAADVAACHLDDTIDDLVDSNACESGICVVVDSEHVVLGVVREEALQLPGETPVRQVLQTGPPSVRPSITTRELAESMDKDGRTYVLVTTIHGVLLGLIGRSDLYGQH